MTEPADALLSPRAVRNVAKLANLNIPVRQANRPAKKPKRPQATGPQP